MLYTNDSATGRTAQLVQQATASIAIGAIGWPDSASRPRTRRGSSHRPSSPSSGPTPPRRTEPTESTSIVLAALLGFGMTILIFMMIVLYGTWVAMSVVEEKSSRVMEVILNAATPFQLLTGKVLGRRGGGVDAVRARCWLPARLPWCCWDPSPSLALGEAQPDDAPARGTDVPMLVLFGVYGVLGFLLYAVLYAAAGSLVSRQEDVSSVVQPLTMVAALGYVVAAYSAMGIIDVGGAVMTALTMFPLTTRRGHLACDGGHDRPMGGCSVAGHPGRLDRRGAVGGRAGVCGRGPALRRTPKRPAG